MSSEGSGTKLKGSRLTEEVYRHLTEAIAERRLAPGQRLHERALAKELGVSRTPVREALQMLINEGLASRSLVGIVVTEITVKDVRDFYQIFQVLQSLACRLAAGRGTDEQMAWLEQLMAEIESAADGNDLPRWEAANKALHDYITFMANNPLLSKMDRLATAMISRIRYLTLHLPGRLEQSKGEHRSIVEAIKTRDHERAGELMLQHLETSEELLVDILENYVVPFRGERF